MDGGAKGELEFLLVLSMESEGMEGRR